LLYNKKWSELISKGEEQQQDFRKQTKHCRACTSKFYRSGFEKTDKRRKYESKIKAEKYPGNMIGPTFIQVANKWEACRTYDNGICRRQRFILPDDSGSLAAAQEI
jgi:hypothetical protein